MTTISACLHTEVFFICLTAGPIFATSVFKRSCASSTFLTIHTLCCVYTLCLVPFVYIFHVVRPPDIALEGFYLQPSFNCK